LEEKKNEEKRKRDIFHLIEIKIQRMDEKIDTYPGRKNNLTTHACVDPKMKVSNSMQLATYLQLLSSGAVPTN